MRRVTLLMAALAGAVVLWLYDAALADDKPSTEAAIYGGLPQAQTFTLKTWTRVFENRGFTVGYSEIRRNPLWVVYHAPPIQHRRPYRRPGHFEADSRSLARVVAEDYLHSGYQRGHLAPSWLIAQAYGHQAQVQTFLMSNITPQRPNLNQKLWQRLEVVETDYFAHWFDGVWVFTGPIFDSHIQHLRHGVEVPDAFYRIFVDEDSQGPKVLAFLVPQTVRGDEPLNQFLTTVDEIEARTGLDFLSVLEDVLENRIESVQGDVAYWRLNQVNRLPSRY